MRKNKSVEANVNFYDLAKNFIGNDRLYTTIRTPTVRAENYLIPQFHKTS